eukprot:5727909-Karenia_brevis.AAC.1
MIIITIIITTYIIIIFFAGALDEQEVCDPITAGAAKKHCGCRSSHRKMLSFVHVLRLEAI